MAAFVASKPADPEPPNCAHLGVPSRGLVPHHFPLLASPEQTGSTSGLVVSPYQLSAVVGVRRWGRLLEGAVVSRGKVSPSKITSEGRLVATLTTTLFPGNPRRLSGGRLL